MTDELVPLEPVTEAQPEPFVITPELQVAVDAAMAALKGRTYSARNPQLGKMVKCAICRERHRANERKCEQVFTYRVGDYELLRENENGELVPDYRTAAKEGERPTMKQMMGAAAFNKKRFNPHHSKIKLQFIERTRKVFEDLGFDVDETNKEKLEKNFQRARVVAARQLRKERKLSTRAVRRMQDTSRRINKGLL